MTHWRDRIRTQSILVACVLGIAVPAAASAVEEPGPAYLVYAGPYSSSPSSAFGHLFLALADSAGQPPPLWDVITFNAETFGANSLRYLSVGIAGGFIGRFSRVQFHEKTREYGVLDDRDLWLLELRLTTDERRRLEAALRHREERWYPYSFFRKNCAYYLHVLLAEVTGALADPSGTVSPTEVLQDVRRSRIGGATFHRAAASKRLLEQAGALRPEVTDRLKGEDWRSVAADTAWLDRLSLRERQFILEFFSLKSDLAVGRLPAETTTGIAHLRASSVAEGGLQPRLQHDGPAPGRATDPEFHGYTRVRLEEGQDEFGEPRTSLEIRGALHQEADPWYGHQPLNTMEFLSLRASSATRRWAPRLESLVVFSQRSLSAPDWIRSRRSWMMELMARRGGLFSDGGLHLEARGGSGRTWRLPGDIHAYGLLTVAAVAQWGEGAALAPGIEAGLVVLAFGPLRLGGRWTGERNAFSWGMRQERASVWSRLDLSTTLGLSARFERQPGGDAWSVGVDWYP